MKIPIFLIILLLASPPAAEQPKLAKLAAVPFSLSIISPASKNIAASPGPTINLNYCPSADESEDNYFGSVGEFIYGMIFVFNQLVEKQPFWKPDKGLIIPLSIGKKPLEVMPSMDYDEKNPGKNSYQIRACFMF